MAENNKLDLRRNLLSDRAAISDDVRNLASEAITNRLKQAIDWRSVVTLHCYLSVGQKHEVNTAEFLDWLTQTFNDVSLFVPVVSEQKLRSAVFDMQTKLRTTSRGIFEPQAPKFADDNMQFDVIIVPMLGFNEDGYRVGYGAGFYDKFLAGQSEAVKVGLCYENGKSEFTPEQHDVPLDVIVTEDSVRTF